MDRRRVLLIIAAVVAALGTLLVFLYVRSADARAQDSVDAVTVLTAAQPIESGESYQAALDAGKIVPKGVARSQLLANVQTSPDALKGTVALQNILPGEQIVADKFGANAADAASPLGIPAKMMAISVNLTDPDRVAGFVNPGSEVAIFVTSTNAAQTSADPNAPAAVAAKTKLLLDRVTVLGVGSTTPVTTTTTAEDGTQQTEQLPRTLLTLALTQDQAQKVILASKTLDVTFALLTKDSTVAEGQETTNTDVLP
ncbi:Flp pilus assembly protein CpaB [Nocardioides islandensis]|jgi:pilus assembly protein CpaB|uniref:Flp pilus assembly protein CpaB n=1 Tax=Nocardioides islandensis TaxID=433663 RepID=A0A930YD13_9ACTN|nr:Flp pilus assembly protein CpaB [Nocardioides islandensis]MBF4763751.1 Flp pilus assembly protein CpaB [Nocardioides islandensis]